MAEKVNPPTLRNVAQLVAHGLVPQEQSAALEDVAREFATAVPAAFLSLIAHPDDPIGRQVIPSAAELQTAPWEMQDPIGDDALSPVPGIVHRYQDRALLKPLLVCPLYCRFCFRREHVGPDGGLLSDEALAKALLWIAEHPAISEIILTGGDPLMLSPSALNTSSTRFPPSRISRPYAFIAACRWPILHASPQPCSMRLRRIAPCGSCCMPITPAN